MWKLKLQFEESDYPKNPHTAHQINSAERTGLDEGGRIADTLGDQRRDLVVNNTQTERWDPKLGGGGGGQI